MKHYDKAIRALSQGEYSDLTEQELRSLLRVLRDERQRLLRENARSPHPRTPSRSTS
jgi:hypothetical protein